MNLRIINLGTRLQYEEIMKKVLLRAPLLTNSGYGVHSRQIFEWLETRKDLQVTSQCLQWGQT